MTISDFFSFFSAAVAIGTAIMITHGFWSLRETQAQQDALVERRLNDMELAHNQEIIVLKLEIAELYKKHNALPCAQTNDAASEIADMVKEVLEEKMPIMKNVHAFMVNIRDTERIKAIVPNLPIDILEALLEKTEVEQIYETAAVVAAELKTRKTQKSAK